MQLVKTIRLLGDATGEGPRAIGADREIPSKTREARLLQVKKNKFDSIKINKFYLSENLNRDKSQPHSEKYTSTHKTNHGFISSIYKSIRKWAAQ